MAKLLVVLVAVCIAGCFGAQLENGRIVGGQDAYPGQFPHQISMQTAGQHFCGGSIVNPTKILTAAHCVYGNTGAIDVVAGIDNLQQRGQRVRVARVFYHGGFDPRSLTNDVAVLILAEPLAFNQFVQPIRLATSDPLSGSALTLSGWGLRAYPPTGDQALQLQTITLAALQSEVCAAALQSYYPTTVGQVCTIAAAGHGACQGDSGGPLIDQSGVQVGVVSYGVPCALGLPDVFTSVAYHLAFINGIN